MASAGRPALTPNPSPDSFLAGEGSTAFLLDQHGQAIHVPTQNFESHPVAAWGSGDSPGHGGSVNEFAAEGTDSAVGAGHGGAVVDREEFFGGMATGHGGLRGV